MTAPLSMDDTRPVVLAAGGTGGHMFPAEALARELVDRGHAVILVTDRRGQAFDETVAGIRVHRIRAGTFGAGVLSKVRTVVELGIGFVQARRLLRRVQPAMVVGFGGYPSLPTVRAAQSLDIPVLLHEQNAVLGRANRFLAPKATRIALSFADLQGIRVGDADKLVFTGNPVRPAVVTLRGVPYPTLDETGPIRLCVFGGSQGARVFADVLPGALACLSECLRRRIQLTQQCRPEDLERVRHAYAERGMADVQLASFFTDIPQRLAASHLVVCRAGASSIAELTMIGRPSILVPYPFATDDHQTVNAYALAGTGAGWVVPQAEFTAETLAVQLRRLFTHPQVLASAAAAALSAGAVDAVRSLADEVVGRIGPAGGTQDTARVGATRPFLTELAA